jgi:hypothetical protein
VDNPTTVDDIGMKYMEPPKTAPQGIVPRLQRPGEMSSINLQPLSRGLPPFYVKLDVKVEALPSANGIRKLYLGLFLGQLYEVHWNNQLSPVSFEIAASDGVEVSPRAGNGPQVDQQADADPREFLVDVSGSSEQPLTVKVQYTACGDAETFCQPVTQYHHVFLERDRGG